MTTSSNGAEPVLAPRDGAPQHGPRPLPLFLDLVRRETGGDRQRMERALAGLRKYQDAPRPGRGEPMPAAARLSGVTLRDYGGEGPPVLFVPSLINPPHVLDLSPDRSLLRWLARRGHRVLMVDWGWPAEERRNLSVSDHVERLLVPLVQTIGEPVTLAGYCLGGTMAAAAAALVPARALALIAAPWNFSGFSDASRADLARLWKQAQPAAEALGVLPMEVLQAAFWSLDPGRTVAKFEAFAGMEGAKAERFVALEDWANDGPPLPASAARELFVTLFGEDRTGAGEWRVAGRQIVPASLDMPILDIVSTSDRIVPAASAMAAGERLELGLGHVGMMVGSRAEELLWEPLGAWLSRLGPSC